MDDKGGPRLDLDQIRSRLQGSAGPEYWRSLEEVADTDEFRRFVDDEFPNRAALLTMDRRQFLKVMGASLALAGLSGCRMLPAERIVPYVRAPEDIVPGQSLFYATAMSHNGAAIGLLAESKMGRPTKIEGNDKHPASLGATDIFAQAALLDLYDPDRGSIVKNQGQIATWEGFLKEARALIARLKASGELDRFAILTDVVTSPTLAGQLEGRRWHAWSPVNRDNPRQGARMAFGKALDVRYDFSKASVVVSLDADFLSEEPGNVRYARDFVDRRRNPALAMNRLYVFESSPSQAGIMADHRVPVRASEIETIARDLARMLGVPPEPGGPRALAPGIAAALAKDLDQARGASIVLAGQHQPPEVHALAYAINEALGNIGKSVLFSEPPTGPPSCAESLAALVEDMKAGKIEGLLILGGNPTYDAPADLGFADALAKVRFRAHLSIDENETSALCDWYLPQSHFLEAWSDGLAYDGTASIVQPLIQPLHDTRSTHELLSELGGSGKGGLELVQAYWKGRVKPKDFDTWWQQTLSDGVVAGTAAAPVHPPRASIAEPRVPPKPGVLEICFRPDPAIWDGRHANNGWLQELPKPFSKLSWDNSLQVSLATAQKLKVQNGDVVKLKLGDASVEGPVWIVPGHANDSVTIHLGFGRTASGRVGTGVGFNVYPLRTSKGLGFATGIEVTPVGRSHDLASTQTHHSMEGRDIVRVGTVSELRTNPNLRPDHEESFDPSQTLYTQPEREPGVAQWGMAIDLNACIGCNACVVACQAENNIPVVGKEEVRAGREMQWIRIDHYYGPRDGNGTGDNPEHVVQPVNCMHCEDAPCEPVCPVAATVHSHEGLNQMVYNRCVGTRYCSNNCPYKVRRFNFLNYQFNQKNFAAASDIPLLKLLNNPDVTVRGRGVMEKCTYCVQRINAARIDAKKELRDIRDGEVVTACHQACPTHAIVFGNIADPKSAVSKLKADQRGYALLENLGTRPRTTYLAKVKNPNPEVKTEP